MVNPTGRLLLCCELRHRLHVVDFSVIFRLFLVKSWDVKSPLKFDTLRSISHTQFLKGNFNRFLMIFLAVL